MKRVDCIYLAAGSGERTGLPYPKQLALLNKRPVMSYGFETLRQMSEVGRIIVTCPSGRGEEFWYALEPYFEGRDSEVLVIEGGSSRQDSCALALDHVQTDRVLIAEGARPFMTAELVRDVLGVDAPAVTAWLPSRSSVVDQKHRSMPDRALVGEVQMPQAFDVELLRKSYGSACSVKEYTCDAHLVHCMTGVFPELVEGRRTNFKVTYPEDLVIARAFLGLWREPA